MMYRSWIVTAALFLSLLALTACATSPGREDTDKAYKPNWQYQPGPVEQLPVMKLADTLQPNDRIVFIGDEMTQQMFYTRSFATAMLSIMPDANLRFFNAGRDGATAESTLQSIDDILKLTRASVVFICLGLNDAMTPPPESETQAQAFTTHMTALVNAVRKHGHVRKIILVGPPAVQTGLTAELPPDSYNARLIELSAAAEKIAGQHNLGYIDLFIHTSAVYLGQMQMTSGGDPLTFAGRLPSEEAHTIIASVLLRGCGVTGKQLDTIAFCPLLPGKMGRIRPALALPTTPPSTELSTASRNIYLALTRFDDAFFKQWRLVGRNRLSWTPAEAAKQVELRWASVQDQVHQLQQMLTPTSPQSN